jgi:hypothetical protein
LIYVPTVSLEENVFKVIKTIQTTSSVFALHVTKDVVANSVCRRSVSLSIHFSSPIRKK